MTQKRQRPRVTINLAATELAYSPSTVELLTNGTAREVRDALDFIAFFLHQGRADELSKATQETFGRILYRIAGGEDPKKALGLNRKKKYGAWYAKQVEWLITDLMRQGLTRAEAEDMMGRFNFAKAAAAKEVFSLEDTESADEKLRKRLRRARTE
jgi:hypothetical protein